MDKALVAGEPFRNIAERFGTSPTALHRHKSEHIPELLAKVRQIENNHADALKAQVAEKQAREDAHALDVVKQLKDINAAAVSILAEARKAGEPETALRAIDRIQKQIELQAKLIGQLDEKPTVNILFSPEWVKIRTVLLRTLGPYPEARAAVAAALAEVDDGSSCG